MFEASQLSGRTYYVKTFGCQMNQHDSERVCGVLDSCGCIPTASPEDADIAVFMTCCVREKADNTLYGQANALKSIQAPPSGRRIVAIGGCIAQREGEDIRRHISNADVVFGTNAIHSLPELLESAIASDGKKVQCDTTEVEDRFSTSLPTRRAQGFHAWVPIMTGCNNFCTYCIVPYVRGREHSRPFEGVVAECERLVGEGVREITLLGQNVNSYGRDRYGEPRFADLMRAVGATGIERLRFTSSNPKDLLPETIQAMAETPGVMPHLHLAVQSGSTRILKAMNRSYTREEYIDLARRIKEAMPEIALTTDLIVGFPGETESDFEDTLSLVREVGFASAYTFIYSKRPGTVAARMEDDTPREVIQERFDRLAKLVEDLSFAANSQDLGTTVEMLVEGPSKKHESVMVGHSKKNQTVHFDVPEGLVGADLVGKMVDIKVEEARTWYLRGPVVGVPH